MLLTMEQAYISRARYLPNAERLDRVAEVYKSIVHNFHILTVAMLQWRNIDGRRVCSEQIRTCSACSDRIEVINVLLCFLFALRVSVGEVQLSHL